MSVETVVNAVEAEVKKVEGEVVAEVKAVEKFVEATVQAISAEEKLGIREIENTYLKAQIEINRLSTITQKAQQDFTRAVEGLTKKYVVDPAAWLFDNIALEFRKK